MVGLKGGFRRARAVPLAVSTVHWRDVLTTAITACALVVNTSPRKQKSVRCRAGIEMKNRGRSREGDGGMHGKRSTDVYTSPRGKPS